MPNRRSPLMSGTSFSSAMTMPNTVKKAVAKVMTGGNDTPKSDNDSVGNKDDVVVDDEVDSNVAVAAEVLMVDFDVDNAACKKKHKLTRSPRTVRMAIEASRANRLSRKGGTEYSVPRATEPARTTRKGVVPNGNGRKQKDRPRTRVVRMTIRASVGVIAPEARGR